MDKAQVAAALLQRSPHRKACSERDLQGLAASLRLHRLRAGQELFRQGEPGDSLLYLAEGRLAVHVDQGGGDALFSELGAGHLIGAASCVDPVPRAATARALGDALVMALDRPSLVALRDGAPAAAVALVGAIISELTTRLRDTNRYIELSLPRRARSGSSLVIPLDLAAPDQSPRPAPYRGAVDLSGLPSLEGLTERDLELLASVAPPMLYPDGASLCVEGASASSCFLVAQGAVMVLKIVGGQLRQLATLGAGSFVGQLALVDRAPRSATVRAQGDAVVLTLGREDFERLLAARSPLAMRFQEQIALAGVRQLRLATARLFSILQREPAAATVPWALSSVRPGPAAQRQGSGFSLSQREVDEAFAHLQGAVTEWDVALSELAAASGDPET